MKKIIILSTIVFTASLLTAAPQPTTQPTETISKADFQKLQSQTVNNGQYIPTWIHDYYKNENNQFLKYLNTWLTFLAIPVGLCGVAIPLFVSWKNSQTLIKINTAFKKIELLKDSLEEIKIKMEAQFIATEADNHNIQSNSKHLAFVLYLRAVARFIDLPKENIRAFMYLLSAEYIFNAYKEKIKDFLSDNKSYREENQKLLANLKDQAHKFENPIMVIEIVDSFYDIYK